MTSHHPNADPHALDIARAVQEAVSPDIVILFGSRAAGDYREDSDVDLLIVSQHKDHRGSTAQGHRAALEYMTRRGISLDAGIIGMDRETFDRCRQASQHIAGQAVLHGVNMSGENLEHSYDHEDDYPTHWPATRQFLEDSATWTRELDEMDGDDHWNKKMIGFAAEQATENAIKAWLSHHQDRGRWVHDLEGAWRRLKELEANWLRHEEIPQEQAGQSAEAQTLVEDLLEHTRYQGVDSEGNQFTGNWLALYGAAYRYGTPSRTLVTSEHRTLRQKVDQAVDAITGVVHQRNGTDDRDVWPDGKKPWDL